MKRLLLVLPLIIGLAIGWTVASMIANRELEKIRASWSPEIQQLMAENTEFVKGLSKADFEQMRKDIRAYSSHMLKEVEIATLHEAILASQIDAYLAKGRDSEVFRILDERIGRLKELQAEGRYKGSEWEAVATNIVARYEARTNVTGTTRLSVP